MSCLGCGAVTDVGAGYGPCEQCAATTAVRRERDALVNARQYIDRVLTTIGTGDVCTVLRETKRLLDGGEPEGAWKAIEAEAALAAVGVVRGES